MTPAERAGSMAEYVRTYGTDWTVEQVLRFFEAGFGAAEPPKALRRVRWRAQNVLKKWAEDSIHSASVALADNEPNG